MIYELAIVEDKGSFYQVIGVTKNELDNLVERDEKLIKLSYNAYTKIKDALADKKFVTINKAMITDEALPDDVNIKNTVEDSLDAYKKMSMRKVNQKLTYEGVKISSMETLFFITLNNDLVHAGYNICNANREEKYIEIIETEDEALIGKLERYLEIMDKVESLNSFNIVCLEFVNKLKNAADEAECDKIVTEFYMAYDALGKS
jgi:hypothetical protein